MTELSDCVVAGRAAKEVGHSDNGGLVDVLHRIGTVEANSAAKAILKLDYSVYGAIRTQGFLEGTGYDSQPQTGKNGKRRMRQPTRTEEIVRRASGRLNELAAVRKVAGFFQREEVGVKNNGVHYFLAHLALVYFSGRTHEQGLQLVASYANKKAIHDEDLRALYRQYVHNGDAQGANIRVAPRTVGTSLGYLSHT